MRTIVFAFAAIILPLAPGCAPVETKTKLMTSAGSQIRSAGPGDVVMSFQSRKALPNIVGGADIWGRTTNAGGTTVRFVGARGSEAVFERTDVVVESNATTITESPMIIPQTTTTTINGTVGMTDVSGTAHSTSYQLIPPRGSSQYATAQRPIAITLGSGQSVTIQGRTLRVVSIAPNSLKYVIE
ncbi:hypothetical protein GOD80_15350 [Sinorhizobium medicae]|uniref:hypothetical protein n=1 Tax=Sinorhizobium medicae TaxID=110321 RepID=UPI000420CFBE|nr:hypothetical protein [Sinorhizobium medicae]MDX0769583.1 hypothetical protein [Sinorhizobium medicae]MDX0806570.1 hypothetical protein [Sinorhizobium medicae]RVQ72880.1 hypothetical protein CN244_11770 [Sinorhizobium medicae]